MKSELSYDDLKIGDTFLLNDNETVVQVTKIDKKYLTFSVDCVVGEIRYDRILSKYGWYYDSDFRLCREDDPYNDYGHLDIKYKCLSLTDKLNVL